MSERWTKRIGAAIGILLFAAAAWVLYRQVSLYPPGMVVSEIRRLPASVLILALFFTGMSFLTGSGFDLLAVKHLKRKLSYPRIFTVSFLSAAVANTVGFGAVSGGSVRFRMYSVWGFSAGEIAAIVLHTSITFALGFLGVGAAVLPFTPTALPFATRSSLISNTAIGLLFLSVIIVYAALTFFVRRPLKTGSVLLRLPATREVPQQLAVAMVNWLFSASTLYVIIRAAAPVSFGTFVSIYVLAMVAGILSQVPGGLGVFETVFVLLLSPPVPTPTLLGSLVVFRVVFFILPLFLAVSIITVVEAASLGRTLRVFSGSVTRWTRTVAPSLVAALIMVAGLVLAGSGALPVAASPLRWIGLTASSSEIEFSHIAAAMAGLALVWLSRSLHQRMRYAYFLTLSLLAVGALVTLAGGVTPVVPGGLLATFFLIVPHTHHFYRHRTRLRPAPATGWHATALVAGAVAIWFLAYSSPLLSAGALITRVRQLPADLLPRVALALLLGLILILVVRRRLRAGGLTDGGEPGRIATFSFSGGQAPESFRAALAATSSPEAALLYGNDKRILAASDTDCFVMYGAAGPYLIAPTAPVGAEKNVRESYWLFREEAEAVDAVPVFLDVDAQQVERAREAGFISRPLGHLLRIDVAGVSGTTARSGTSTVSARERDSEPAAFSYRIFESGQPAPESIAVESASRAVKRGGQTAGGFFHGPLTTSFLKRAVVATVWHGGHIRAYAVILPSPDGSHARLDRLHLFSPSPEAPSSLDLISRTMSWLGENGYSTLDIGLFENDVGTRRRDYRRMDALIARRTVRAMTGNLPASLEHELGRAIPEFPVSSVPRYMLLPEGRYGWRLPAACESLARRRIPAISKV